MVTEDRYGTFPVLASSSSILAALQILSLNLYLFTQTGPHLHVSDYDAGTDCVR